MASKKKAEEPIKVLEIISYPEGGFEIRMAQFQKEAIPVLVGLLEKAKFDLLARDFDEDGPDEGLIPMNNHKNFA
jgi:hypothetical protein